MTTTSGFAAGPTAPRRSAACYAQLLADDVVATINASTVVGREGVTDYVAATVKEMPSLRVEVEILAEVRALADEQAALLGVAERVPRGDPPDEIFTAVADAARALLGGQAMTLNAFEPRENALVVVSRSGGPAPPGTRIVYEADTLPDHVRRGARPVRVDDYRAERDAELARRFGLAAAVAAPIALEGGVWGMLTATSADGPLPPGTEDRLQRFANLVGTAVANTTSRAQLVASRARVLSTADETRRTLQRDPLHRGARQRRRRRARRSRLWAHGPVRPRRRSRRQPAHHQPRGTRHDHPGDRSAGRGTRGGGPSGTRSVGSGRRNALTRTGSAAC